MINRVFRINFVAFSGEFAKKVMAGFAVWVVEPGHHLEEVVIYLLVKFGVFVVGGVRCDKVTDHRGSSRDGTGSTSRQEAQISPRLSHLLLRPLLESHELLAERHQAISEADRFVSVQDLPHVQLLVPALVLSLLFLHRSLVLLLAFA